MGIVNEEALHAAEVRIDPFPHAVIDNLLDPAFFQQLLENLPTPDEFGPLRAGTLGAVKLDEPPPGHAAVFPHYKLPPFTAYFQAWQSIIAPALIEKFRPYYEGRHVALFGPHWRSAVDGDPDNGFIPTAVTLQLRRTGHYLPPHYDNIASFATGVLYLKSINQPEPDGTVLYRTDVERGAAAVRNYRSLGSWFPPEDLVPRQAAVTVEDRPNRMCAFFMGPGSLHSVGPVKAEYRYGIQTQIQVPPAVQKLFDGWTYKPSGI